ncbi:MAG TPA: glycosyltransferase family 1 protein [Gaiellaceae bacterium]|nr:glycosyltransferase family 1 protein [Gaiellaceae bacterium]
MPDSAVLGIALLTLVPGELGGSESAARELLAALARGGTLPYRVYLPPVAPDAGEGLPSTVVEAYRRAHSIPGRLAAMSLAAARPGPLASQLAETDAVHYPLTIRIPPVRVPSAITLHDVQHLDLPQLFSRGERAFRSLAYHRSARSARIVIVPSAFVRDRAAERLGLDRGKIRVIHHGIDHERFNPGADPPPREPFLLYPARPWQHKNHTRLYEAFALLRRERPELRLVLTGGGHSGETPEGVEALGNVSLDELVSLYRRASALVFPSLYEGFGLPPLEAMACGCPVASSAAASLPEVCGNAARYFSPDDPEELAAAVSDVLDAPSEWIERGLARAAEFTWERAAADHETVYRELLGVA